MSATLPASVPQDVPVGSTQQIGAPVVSQSLLLLAANAGQLNGLGPTPAQISGGIPIYANSDPSALTGLLDGAIVAGTGSKAGYWYTSDGSGNPILWMQDGVITAAVSLASPVLFGGTVGAPGLGLTGYATTGFYGSAANTIGVAVSGALDFSFSANSFNVLAGSSIAMAASTSLAWGSTDVLSASGSAFLWTHTTGNLVVSNTAVAAFTVLKGGTATSATGVKFTDSADQVQFQVLNDGSATLDGTLSAAGFTASGTIEVSDGGLLIQKGVGTGTGELIQIVGPDSTHGWATYQYEATISPAAVETALFTVPIMSRIMVVQANVETALTGGGTTATFSIGITGDVDAYGTASTNGVQADLLTKNAKINAMGTNAANAGASLGVFSAATVALKLIAAATGGAAAGNTALTVGSVKIRVLYQTLLPIVDAA